MSHMDIFSGQSTHVPTKSSPVETSSGPRPSTHLSTKSSPVKTSPPKGYEDAPIYKFTGIKDLRKCVQLLSDKLVAGHTTEQYLVFWGVTKDQLTQIDHQRASIGKGIRMTHYTDTDLLIVKVPTIEHETAHTTISYKVNRKLEGMGLPELSLWPCGSTTYHASGSSKEGDSTYKPMCRTRGDDWPVLVIEAGVSETLARLRTDADWWLTKSGGEVRIAIVISIVRAAKSLRVEKWCLPQARPGPVTRANPRVSTKIQELTITQNPPIPPPQGTIPTYTVTGAPLILEFEKLLLRVPVPPEGDVIFTAAELQAWVAAFWSMVQ
jgi:hypothetical protein